MKKAYLLLGLSLMLAVSACKKDEDDNDDTKPFPQELVVDGTRYEWGESFMEYYPDYGVNSENLDLFMFTDGITVHYDSDNLPDSISGNGYVLYFELFSADSTYLSAGTYTADSTLAQGTYYSSFLAPVTNGELSGDEELNSATVEVVREDNVYTITGSGKDGMNRDFSFSYQGAIRRI
jgi:hypothetical protein